MLTQNEYRAIRRGLQSGAPQQIADIKEGLAAGHLKPEDFSIKQLAEHTVEDGREWVDSLNPNLGGGFHEATVSAVDTSQFSNITGQIVYSKVMDAALAEEYSFSREVTTQSTQFNGEKIPGVTNLGDAAQIVEEGGAFPNAGVSEDYIETPVTTKRGLIVPVTKEAIFFDRTGLVLTRAGAVGDSLGLNKEKRIIDCIIDENRTNHRYKWRGTSYATYQASTPWINKKTSNALNDWTNVDAVEQLFNNLLDPNTGEPIMVMANVLIVNPQLINAAYRIINATSIEYAAGGYPVTGNPTVTLAPNPVGAHPMSAKYRILSSRLFPTRTATDTDWFLGNLKKAFAYMENWPITVVQAPFNSEAEFTNDIVLRFKASERGTAATLEPRAIAKSSS